MNIKRKKKRKEFNREEKDEKIRKVRIWKNGIQEVYTVRNKIYFQICRNKCNTFVQYKNVLSAENRKNTLYFTYKTEPQHRIVSIGLNDVDNDAIFNVEKASLKKFALTWIISIFVSRDGIFLFLRRFCVYLADLHVF